MQGNTRMTILQTLDSFCSVTMQQLGFVFPPIYTPSIKTKTLSMAKWNVSLTCGMKFARLWSLARSFEWNYVWRTAASCQLTGVPCQLTGAPHPKGALHLCNSLCILCALCVAPLPKCTTPRKIASFCCNFSLLCLKNAISLLYSLFWHKWSSSTWKTLNIPFWL